MPEPCVDFRYCDSCGGVGQDDNAHFWCHDCKGQGTVQARLFHYEVVSPVMNTGGYYGPLEPFQCWGVYLAPNAKAARVLAVKDTKEFGDWVTAARGDNRPPFADLDAHRFLCDHGACIGC